MKSLFYIYTNPFTFRELREPKHLAQGLVHGGNAIINTYRNGMLHGLLI